MMKSIILFLFPAIIIFLFSCEVNSNIDLGEDEDDEDGTYVVDVRTVPFELQSSGYVEFSTNNSRLLTRKGSTFWSPLILDSTESDYIEVETFKSSGDSSYGYGIIFDVQEDVISKDSIVHNFYALLIKTNTNSSHYQLVKVVEELNADNSVDVVQHHVALTGADSNGWCLSNLLFKGIGVKNIIKICYSGKDAENISSYDIYFNGQKELTYKDNFNDDDGVSLSVFDGDKGARKYGYIVTLSPAENYPEIPTKVFWKKSISN